MTTPATVNGIPLPTWADEASVQTYLTTGVSLAVAFLTLLHPGFTEPAVVPAVIPAVAFVIAGGAQLVNVIWHRKATIAAISAGFPLDKPPAA